MLIARHLLEKLRKLLAIAVIAGCMMLLGGAAAAVPFASPVEPEIVLIWGLNPQR